MFKKCKYCGSIWVCWNAWHSKANTGTIHYADGRTEPNKESWTWECWDCGGGDSPSKKVRTGIPYFLLRKFFTIFHAEKYAAKSYHAEYLLGHIKNLLLEDESIKFPEYDSNHIDNDHRKWLLDQIKEFMKTSSGG